jgi:hypothetical protein
MAIGYHEITVKDQGLFSAVKSTERDTYRLYMEDADDDRTILHVPTHEWEQLCRETCGEVAQFTIGEFTISANGKYLEIDKPNDGRACISPEQLHEMCARGLGPDSLVDPQKTPGWVDGPPTEIGPLYAVRIRSEEYNRDVVGYLTEASGCRAPFVSHETGRGYELEWCVRHFLIPDPPQAKVPDPPKWVRVKCVAGHHHIPTGAVGWGFKHGKVWHVAPDFDENVIDLEGDRWVPTDG